MMSDSRVVLVVLAFDLKNYHHFNIIPERSEKPGPSKKAVIHARVSTMLT